MPVIVVHPTSPSGGPSGPGPGPLNAALAFGPISDNSLGVDISSLNDLDPNFNLVAELPCLGQDLAHRLETPRGGLLDDPNYGYDLRGKLNDVQTQADLTDMQGAIEQEFEKDDRVLSATATVTYKPGSSSLSAAILITISSGIFQLILNVTSVTVEMLSITPA